MNSDTAVLETVRDVIDHAAAGKVFGAPVSQDGITVLPVAKVSGGGGGGSGAADGALSLSIEEPHVALPALVARLGERGVRPTRLLSRTATLDDVFLSLTGRTLREA